MNEELRNELEQVTEANWNLQSEVNRLEEENYDLKCEADDWKDEYNDLEMTTGKYKHIIIDTYHQVRDLHGEGKITDEAHEQIQDILYQVFGE